MKKIVTALLAIFAVAGVPNLDAACCGGCPVKSACPEKKPCCKRESKCPSCNLFVSKCGCKSESKDVESSDSDMDMSADDDMDSMDDSF